MNPYALIWSITAGVGIVLSLLLIFGIVLDLRALGRIANGRRKRTWARLASESIRLAIHAGFFVIGIGALDSPVGDFNGTIVTLLAGNFGLILISLIAVYVARIEPSVESVADTAARDLVLQAEAAAQIIERAAEKAASKLKRAEASEPLEVRKAEAAERTADATEKIADAQNGPAT